MALPTVDRLGIGYWVLHILPVGNTPMAGFCGFRLMDDGPEIELMYGLSGDHWGKGLATEASAATLEHLWRSNSHARVYARCDLPNSRSVRARKRLGMAAGSTTTMVTYLLRRPGWV